jgi:hypothetical protein
MKWVCECSYGRAEETIIAIIKAVMAAARFDCFFCVLIASALIWAGSAEADSRANRHAARLSQLSSFPESIRDCDFMSVHVFPMSASSYSIAVEYGVMTKWKAKKAEELSRRLADRFSHSLDRQGFKIVDSAENAFWIAKTQAEAGNDQGEFVAVVMMQPSAKGEHEIAPGIPPALSEASAHGMSALINTHLVRLNVVASEIADRATLFFLPEAVKLCREQERAVEAEEARKIREELVEEMRKVREQKQQRREIILELETSALPQSP